MPARKGGLALDGTVHVSRVDGPAEHRLPRLDALGVEHRPLDGPRPWQALPGVPGFPRQLSVSSGMMIHAAM